MQIKIPFKEVTDIPQSHFYAFRVCNSAAGYGRHWHRRQLFYRFKMELLAKYGHAADYDLQHIEKKCNSCDGKGNHYTGAKCWRCDNGVYVRKKIVLERYIMNGAVFHNPVGELMPWGDVKIFNGFDGEYGIYPSFRMERFNGRLVNDIRGIVEHENMKLNANWALYYLFWHYNRPLFHILILAELKSYQTNTQSRFKKLLKQFAPLEAYAEFLSVKKEEISDLPF